ncbi:hypothetical protein Clacol_004388 [Clathrus columnatus]|uniref:Uncharacterized protein n=1 Tax=Clathrus columnatus TaxID=1419009 RepID=A0AAV5A8Z6_9AGAM|nr:hypothetical protein Clacol_004388 [Clathrus columnatus]
MTLFNPAISHKLLPKTPYVALARYRTDLFNFKRWQEHPIECTWEEEIKQLIQSDLECLPLLHTVARAVDDLEKLLQHKGKLWSDCGFGTTEVKLIDKLKTSDLSQFLTTQLLDLLYWGCDDVSVRATAQCRY